MRPTITLVALLVVFGGATACSEPASNPSAAPSPSALASGSATSTDETPQETESVYEGMFTPAQACETADLTYRELDEVWQKQIRAGVAAERRGDKAGVAKALAALQPLHSSTAATLADAAAKIADPTLKAALNSLADASAKSTLFTSFAEFQSLAALTGPAETTLKRECPKHGYQLKNLT